MSDSERQAVVKKYYLSTLESSTAIWPDVIRALEPHYSDAFGADLDSAGIEQLALAAIGFDLSVLKRQGFGKDVGPREALAAELPSVAGDDLAFERVSLYAKHFYNDAHRLRLDRPDAGFAYLTALGIEETGFRVKHGDQRFWVARELEGIAARISNYPEYRMEWQTGE